MTISTSSRLRCQQDGCRRYRTPVPVGRFWRLAAATQTPHQRASLLRAIGTQQRAGCCSIGPRGNHHNETTRMEASPMHTVLVVTVIMRCCADMIPSHHAPSTCRSPTSKPSDKAGTRHTQRGQRRQSSDVDAVLSLQASHVAVLTSRSHTPSSKRLCGRTGDSAQLLRKSGTLAVPHPHVARGCLLTLLPRKGSRTVAMLAMCVAVCHSRTPVRERSWRQDGFQESCCATVTVQSRCRCWTWRCTIPSSPTMFCTTLEA